MPSPIVVWIIEDNAPDAARAGAIVDEAARGRRVRVTRHHSPSLVWPGSFAGAGKGARIPLPDLVILDLYTDGTSPDGIDFYRELRRREANEQADRNSMIIIWSNYTDQEDTESFVRGEVSRDDRLVALATKQVPRLRQAVAGCLGRVVEEDADR
jgi:CheY-like chemotaxis protein